ncbi:MAG: RecX family transcriptional regulator [Clostridia bacterium]|nr:RecX family transcriptional regulator [Clostridia bacterium]
MEIPKDLSECVKRALNRLNIGDLTCGEMQAYLTDRQRKHSFSPELAERTVCLLVQEGFLDDKRYLKLFVRHLDEKCYGPGRIRRELIRRRFPPSYVDAALARRIDYSARAYKFLEKKSGAAALAQTPAGRKKLQDALVRYGYDYSTALGAVKQFSREDDFSD